MTKTAIVVALLLAGLGLSLLLGTPRRTATSTTPTARALAPRSQRAPEAKRQEGSSPSWSEETSLPRTAENPRPAPRNDRVAAHPQSPERDALLQARAQIDGIEEALNDRAWDEAGHRVRAFVRAYRDSPRWQDRVAGYPLILGCLRAQSTTDTGEVNAFLEKFSGSPLARKVRRACLPR